MSTLSERAVRDFENGCNCAQAVLAAFAPGLGLERDDALRVACAFGAGVCRLGETCGAVSGALMVTGLRHADSSEGQEVSRDKTYEAARIFQERFKARHGSVVCRKLIGYDLKDPVDYRAAREHGIFGSVCPHFVASAIEILEDLDR
jgi:C_GCAxxG_C_C family probable redox protein